MSDEGHEFSDDETLYKLPPAWEEAEGPRRTERTNAGQPPKRFGYEEKPAKKKIRLSTMN